MMGRAASAVAAGAAPAAAGAGAPPARACSAPRSSGAPRALRRGRRADAPHRAADGGALPWTSWGLLWAALRRSGRASSPSAQVLRVRRSYAPPRSPRPPRRARRFRLPSLALSALCGASRASPPRRSQPADVAHARVAAGGAAPPPAGAAASARRAPRRAPPVARRARRGDRRRRGRGALGAGARAATFGGVIGLQFFLYDAIRAAFGVGATTPARASTVRGDPRERARSRSDRPRWLARGLSWLLAASAALIVIGGGGSAS